MTGAVGRKRPSWPGRREGLGVLSSSRVPAVGAECYVLESRPQHRCTTDLHWPKRRVKTGGGQSGLRFPLSAVADTRRWVAGAVTDRDWPKVAPVPSSIRAVGVRRDGFHEPIRMSKGLESELCVQVVRVSGH